MRQMHVTEVKNRLNKAEKNKVDVVDVIVATIGSTPVVRYQGTIVGRNAATERYRIKLVDSGQIRTFALCLIIELDGAEVIW